MVVTRSAADTPVETPFAASIVTVKAVLFTLLLCSTIGGKSSCWQRSSVMHKQTMPLP